MRTQALEQAIDAVVAVDARNQITLFNAAAEALWGLERTTVLGQCASVLALGDLRVANGQSGQNLAIARADGTLRHVRLHIAIFGTDGDSNPGAPAKQFAAFLHDDASTGNEPGATLSPPGLRMLSLCLDHAENPVMITDAHGTIC